MSDSETETEYSAPKRTIPKFKSQIPLEVMGELTPVQRLMLDKLSISEQQNAWIMERLIDGEQRMNWAEEQIRRLARLKELITAKWSVIAFIVVFLLIPLGLAVAGAYLSKWIKHP